MGLGKQFGGIMSIEKGLFQYIQSAASISTAGVSTAKGQGVYWILAPKSSLYPFIVLQRVATTENYNNGRAMLASAMLCFKWIAMRLPTTRAEL